MIPTNINPKSVRPKKRGPYSGDSECTKRRCARLQKDVALEKCLQSVPSLRTYFNKSPSTIKRPVRSCASLYITSNNAKRRVPLEIEEKKRKAIWARAPNNNKQRRASKKLLTFAKKDDHVWTEKPRRPNDQSQRERLCKTNLRSHISWTQ